MWAKIERGGEGIGGVGSKRRGKDRKQSSFYDVFTLVSHTLENLYRNRYVILKDL